VISAEFVHLCIIFARSSAWSISPTLSNFSQHSTLSHDTTTSASSLGSVHAVPDFEASFYYLGISPDSPTLLYRTGHDKHPFFKPKEFEAYRMKSVRGVYGHPLNAVWKTVGPLVRDLLKTQRIRYTSIDVARFITYGDKEEEIPGPVVIWVGVYPGSTTADTAHDSSKDILTLLKGYDIEDVEVEWRESIYRSAGGSALLCSFDNLNTVDICGPITAALGVPIATSDRPDAQGTVGFYFHEGGNSDKVMGVTCHHVLFETTHLKNDPYEFKGADAPRKYVRLFGLRRFQKFLDSIEVRIGKHKTTVKYYEGTIKKLQKMSEDQAKKLQENQRLLVDTNKAIEDLERLHTKVETEWGVTDCCNIGHICYSPAVSYNTGEEGYTEDWGTFECYEGSFKDAFMGNVVDLGAF